MLLGCALLAISVVTSLGAGYLLAGRLRTSRSAAETWLTTGLLAMLLPYAAWYGVSLARGFDRFFAPAATVGLGLAVMGRLGPGARWRQRLRGDATKVRDAFRRRPESLLHLSYVALAAGAAFVVSLAQVLWYPTWSWDCVWYHLAQTRLILQERTLHYWVDTHVGYINGYPRLVEATAAYATLLLGGDWLDDASQLPWGLIGAAAVVAWCRRLGIQRSTALALGLGWVLCPAVFLQLHTTHADVAAGALFVSLAYFLCAPRFTGRAVALAGICAGGLLATKVSGLLLVVVLSPLALGQLIRVSWQRRRWRVRGAHLVVAVAALAIGATQAAHNAWKTGNPFYPARVKVPFLHTTLPGTIDEAQVANGQAFFQQPGSFHQMLERWYAEPGVPFPDIRERPFGLTFNHLTLPALVLAWLGALLLRRWRLVPLGWVAAAAVMVPAPWWGRFVLGVPAMALVATGALLEWLRPRARVLQLVGCAALGFFAVGDLVRHAVGYRQVPSLRPSRQRGEEDRLRAEMVWMLPRSVVEARDVELGRGAVWAYDESVNFLGEYWNRATTSRAVFVPSRRPPAEYLAALQDVGARWVTVATGSPAERALVEGPRATRVASGLYGGSSIYRLPAPGD